MALKPLTKPFRPAPQRPPVPVERPQPAPIPPAEPEPVSAPAPATSAPENLVEPREMSFEEVCGYLDMRPGSRQYYTNRRGEYIRSLVEEHVWTRRGDGTVTRIPKWFSQNGRPSVGGNNEVV